MSELEKTNKKERTVRCFLCLYNDVLESGRMCKDCIKLMEDMIHWERINQ